MLWKYSFKHDYIEFTWKIDTNLYFGVKAFWTKSPRKKQDKSDCCELDKYNISLRKNQL